MIFQLFHNIKKIISLKRSLAWVPWRDFVVITGETEILMAWPLFPAILYFFKKKIPQCFCFIEFIKWHANLKITNLFNAFVIEFSRS